MRDDFSLAASYEPMLRAQEPNFLRLYLNPHVARCCFSLDRYVRTTWTSPARQARDEDYQSFLANSLEEAVSGAVKLVRYNHPTDAPRPDGLIVDPAGRLAGFASTTLADGRIVPFLPGLRVFGAGDTDAPCSPLVLVAGADDALDRHAATIRALVQRDRPVVITCLDRDSLAKLRHGQGGILQEIVPDVVVFDESFVNHAVPFGAFTARQSLFACWNRPGKSTFHSTTFQPNTISTRHFMACLERADPEFYQRFHDDLARIATDTAHCALAFRRHYNPALSRLIRATGFDTRDIRAAGAFLYVNGRALFDGVAGVACSIRGHNPPEYAEEMRAFTGPVADLEAELRGRLEALTGLECFVPAVSGASAVESALKLALTAQFPKRHILALKSGFGGKTLFALSGTANPSYKDRIEPLYSHVHYIDPFAPDATAQVDAFLASHDCAVVQLELVQSVGGVRAVPDELIRHLDAGRQRWGYLLLVDEIQTGMYRTGPFVRSTALGLKPDFLLLGKGTSDMMFPFALTLYNTAVRESLARQGSDLATTLRARYAFEFGYKTVLNVLRRAESRDLPRQVAEASALFTKLLAEGRGTCALVSDVRVFGLLIGIELDAERRPHRWLRKRLSALYLLRLLRHADFPVFAGFCQYEPNVLKITPPLNVHPEEATRACAAIFDVLRQPLSKTLVAGIGSLIKSSSFWKKNHEHGNTPALEPAAR